MQVQCSVQCWYSVVCTALYGAVQVQCTVWCGAGPVHGMVQYRCSVLCRYTALCTVHCAVQMQMHSSAGQVQCTVQFSAEYLQQCNAVQVKCTVLTVQYSTGEVYCTYSAVQYTVLHSAVCNCSPFTLQ